MKRHLFLILNHGGIISPLPNVSVDRKNYISFFQSPEGGYWSNDEISVYDDNFDFDVFVSDIRFQQLIQAPYEYIVIVFCGHGYTDEKGEQWFETRPDNSYKSDVSLTQIKNICQNTRTLLISDACSSIHRRVLNENRLRYFSGVSGVDLDYALSCKRLYNSLIKLVPSNTFVAGFAASKGETANDNAEGGYYSQSLLKNAQKMVNLLKNDESYKNYNHVVFSYIHALAKDDVIKMSLHEQHPTIEMQRDKHQIPFVVVAK